MSENTTIGTIITIIIIVLVLVIAIFGIIKLNSSGTLKELFPDFGKENRTVSYNEEFFLENPEMIEYCIEDEKNEICFKFNENKLWSWILIDSNEWLIVSNSLHINFKNLDNKNKNFISQLINKGAENGLKQIAERVLKNEGDSFLVFDYDVDLNINIDNVKWTESYESGDKRLLDLDGLIDRLNQVTRGVIRQAGAENEI